MRMLIYQSIILGKPLRRFLLFSPFVEEVSDELRGSHSNNPFESYHVLKTDGYASIERIRFRRSMFR